MPVTVYEQDGLGKVYESIDDVPSVIGLHSTIANLRSVIEALQANIADLTRVPPPAPSDIPAICRPPIPGAAILPAKLPRFF